MRPVALGVATSVVASAATYLILTAVEALSPALRVGAMAVVLALGLLLAWLASRGARRGDRDVTVGHRVKARGGVAVGDVNVEGSGGEVRVGDRVKSGGEVRVQGVRVRDPRDRG